MSRRLLRIGLLVAALGTALALPAGQAPDRARAQADLKKLTEQLERVEKQVRQDEIEKDRLSRELRESERAVAKAQAELTRLRQERGERNKARTALQAERAKHEAEKARTEADLEKQLRAAYYLGQSESLQLLLNQRSPGEASRNLAYYGFLGRARAGQIAKLNEEVARIDELTARIDEEDARLAELEADQKAQVADLDQARKRRGQVLASLQREASDRNASLRRLRQQRAQQEKLIRELERSTEALPYDPDAPFPNTRGRLHWPVNGKLAVNYGATISGLGKAEFIEIDTNAGANVAAVHEGRVLFADWISTRGQMVIIDHGGGKGQRHLTLYGHLGQLYVQKGDTVRGGQVIGTAGDTGGRRAPGLYFELRRNGAPIDPRPWFRSPAPPR